MRAKREEGARLRWLALLGVFSLMSFGAMTGLAEDDSYDIDEGGGTLMEPCDEGSDNRAECSAEASDVQSRGTLVPPLIPFKLKSDGASLCLRPESSSAGARVRLYSCANYTSRYWEAINGARYSPIKGEFGADWAYALRNQWTGRCISVRKTDPNADGILVMADCGSGANVNFVPSPSSPWGGEFIVIRGENGGARGSAGKQFCIRAYNGSVYVRDSANTTYECSNWASLRWRRTPL